MLPFLIRSLGNSGNSGDAYIFLGVECHHIVDRKMCQDIVDKIVL